MTTIEDAVKQAIDNIPTAKQPPVVQPRVAANICKMLERVQVTGMESIGWVEAYQVLQQIAIAGGEGPPAQGVPFQGTGG